MEPHRMFQDVLLAEHHRAFHDTPSNKMHNLGTWPSNQVWMRERCCHQLMFAHKLVPPSFKPSCLSLSGKNPYLSTQVTFNICLLQAFPAWCIILKKAITCLCGAPFSCLSSRLGYGLTHECYARLETLSRKELIQPFHGWRRRKVLWHSDLTRFGPQRWRHRQAWWDAEARPRILDGRIHCPSGFTNVRTCDTAMVDVMK